MCNLLAVIYKCFPYPNMLYASVHYEKATLMHLLFLTSKRIVHKISYRQTSM